MQMFEVQICTGLKLIARVPADHHVLVVVLLTHIAQSIQPFYTISTG